jgi:predicted phosphodiesterase
VYAIKKEIVMLTRIVGDTHGKHAAYHKLLNSWDGDSIQIGDYGLGFSGYKLTDEWVTDWQLYNPQHRFIRGNHDNPEACRAAPNWIADGTVEHDVMFIGGAWSIDNPVAPPGWYRRTAGIDWWPDEECSDDQFELMFETYKRVKPRVMITHDCPASISYYMFWGSGLIKGPTYPNRTSAWFEQFYKAHQPDHWLFGHWHKTMTHKQGNTIFQCIGELDFVDIDI